MKKQDLKLIKEMVESEGFDYCFRHYSNFDGIKDEEFHMRRRVYVDAAQGLIEYLGLQNV